MIASLCYIDSAGVILSCDGKTFSIIGDSPTAESLRLAIQQKNSGYQFFKKEEGEKFDPVDYWFTSSQNFADADPPVGYSKETLESFKAQLEKTQK